ncbi:MAG: preprotein translocase subunit SecE [Patescibacteria group bacterium]
MSFTQYIKDTRGELNHVAWPTQAQTITYTALVIGVSIIVAFYLGFFDFVFTKGLGEFLSSTNQTPPAITLDPVTIDATTTPPAPTIPTFDVTGIE